MSCQRIALCVAGTTLSYHALTTLKSADLRGTLSALCASLAAEPRIAEDVVRDAFTAIEVVPGKQTPGHTHPAAANARSSARAFATKLALYCGAQLFIPGMSKADQRKGYRGTRQWFWAKDTKIDNRRDLLSPDDIAFICDVDYYLDMPYFLASGGNSVLLYTVVPESAASVGQEQTSFHFNADGSLKTLVAGGGSYEHHLWDYAHDSLICTKYWFGIPVRVVTYAVERKQVVTNRQIILLTPMKIFTGLSAVIAHFLVDGARLERFNPIQVSPDGQRFVRFEVHKADGTFVTTGKPGSLLSATIPATVDEAIAGVARLGSTKLMLPTTASWLAKDQRQEAVILTEFHRSGTAGKMPVVYPVELGVRAYQYEPSAYDQEARPKMQAFMSPLVHEAYAPVNNAASERRCVEGRVNGLRKPEPRPNSFRDSCIEEFAVLILGNNILEPVCYEVVAKKQTGPAQVLSLARAAVHGVWYKFVLKCFLKAECYAGPKDPRNISTYSDTPKLEMSQFALALSEHLKQFPWYAPGKTPLEIAHRVTEICTNAEQFVNVSDYHRMDGTITATLRQVDRVVMMKAFRNHRGPLNELLKSNVNNKGILPHGTTFDQGYSHGSGCPATSVFQTLRAAFTAYLAFRHSRNDDGRYFTPEESFGKIGIHMGDDGLDADLGVDDHSWAAASVGLILEADVVHRRERGVNFLARYYSPEVWQGCSDSMCDIKRQLSKFHTTVRLPDSVSPEQKLVEKAMSYVATDRNTPVLGELCTHVLSLSPYRPDALFGIGYWWAKYDNSVQYPNENAGGWMDVELSQHYSEFDRDMFSQWLAGTKSLKEVLKAPLCAEPKPPTAGVVDIVVDDEVVPAQPKSEEVSKDTPKRKNARKVPVARKQVYRQKKSCG